MVVVLSRSANVEFCPSKLFRTPVTPHETNLLLSETTVRQLCFLWSGEELQHRQIDFPRHPLETLSLGAIIKLFSTNGLSIPNHFDYCTNDEQVSSGTDHGTIIFTDHSDNESVKDQDNQVSRQPKRT